MTSLYFLCTDRKPQRIKIGIAKDVHRRLAELQTGCPEKIALLGAIPMRSAKHAKHIESRLHGFFSYLRVHGEWFRADEPLRRFITAATNPAGTDIESALAALRSMRW